MCSTPTMPCGLTNAHNSTSAPALHHAPAIRRFTSRRHVVFIRSCAPPFSAPLRNCSPILTVSVVDRTPPSVSAATSLLSSKSTMPAPSTTVGCRSLMATKAARDGRPAVTSIAITNCRSAVSWHAAAPSEAMHPEWPIAGSGSVEAKRSDAEVPRLRRKRRRCKAD